MYRLEHYGLIGDTHAAALVSREGSVDWLCVPRFDSGSCFAAILDPVRGGHWSIRPRDDAATTRAYRPDSLVLETTFHTASGRVVLTDCLVLERPSHPYNPKGLQAEEVMVRTVTGAAGMVPMVMRYRPRFDYGHIVPWFRRKGACIEAVGGSDALDLCADVPLSSAGDAVEATFDVRAGETVTFVATHHPAHLEGFVPRSPAECPDLVEGTDRFWRDWAARCRYEGRWRAEVVRSLLTLKALTFSPSGGVVAAPTTSLPERIGGVRNWDYRYCWVRDATFTLDALIAHGYTVEAREWVGWLLRAVAGTPEAMRIMYGVMGERRIPEHELPWLEGYEGSAPVRIGNAAAEQFQLDVYGEVMDVLHAARDRGIELPDEAWALQRNIVDFVCAHWHEPDEGIWEVRSGREHFVHSKVMAWVAVDRGIKAAARLGCEGRFIDRWRRVRDTIRSDVLAHGYDTGRGRFRRSYGSSELDATLLVLPLVGFIPVEDPRMRRTVEAVEQELCFDRLVLRYRTDRVADGLPPGEGAFLMCSFWLAECLILLGRADEAEAVCERLISLTNDLGLLSEQFDGQSGRMLGNFPQAFSHVALVNLVAAMDRFAAPRAITHG